MTSKDLETEITKREASRAAMEDRVRELRATREEISLSDDAKERERVRRALAAAEADLVDEESALRILRQQLELAKENERVERLRAHVARVRNEAKRAAEIVERMSQIAAEYRKLDRESQALDVIIRESWPITRELGEQRIELALANAVGLLGRFHDAKEQHAIAVRARELRESLALAA